MSAIQDPNLGLNYGWEYGEDLWNEEMDENLKKLGAIIQLTFDSFVSSLTGSPSSGDRYILTSGVHADDLAVWIGDVWEYHTPAVGWKAYCFNTGTNWVFTADGWTVEPISRINTQAGTSYVVQDVDNDAKTYIRMTSSSSNTVQIKTLLTTPLSVSQRGTGTTTLVAGSGVTLNGNLDFSSQHQTKTIVPIGSGEYDIIG